MSGVLSDPKKRNCFVTEGISADVFRIESRKRAKHGIETTIHFHSNAVVCGDHEHEVISSEE